MNHLRACRICLAYDIRLHSISGCQLRDIYEKFTETPLETGDTKPTCVCYICFSLLKKFHKFIEKSKKSNQLLEQIIDSGLELSVNSLDFFCKQQTGILWNLRKTPTVRVISATEEEVNMETPVKTEYVNSETDMGDQNDDDLDGILLEEEFNQDSSSDSEDNVPLQNFSQQWKVDRIKASEIKTSKILKPVAREVNLSKEEQLQQMLERSKSTNYQNSLFKCDLCYEVYVDTKAFENHQEKHDVGLQLFKKRKSDNGTEKKRLKGQALFKKVDKGEKNKEQNEDDSKIPNFEISSKKSETRVTTIIPNNETTTSNINSDIKNSEVRANSNDRVTAPKNIFICDVCQKEYFWKIFLEKHIKKWHVFKLDSKPNSLTDSNTKDQNCKNNNLLKGKYVQKNATRVRIQTEEQPYKCSYCMKCFTSTGDLTRHVRIHTGEKPYKCSYCMKCFTTSSYLAQHVRIHTGEKPYKCYYCTKCFNQRAHLDTHVRIHTGEQPYKCSYCTKCFTQRAHLDTHGRIHTGEKPYKCNYCTKCFTQRATLDTHVRIHTGEQPYKCSYCVKCFTTSSSLATHVRFHTGEKPYKCSYCVKYFSNNSALAAHVRIHTGEKPYQCSYCSKRFSDSSALAHHLKIHRGEKPHKCSYCTKCFTSTGDLARHVRIHTGEKPHKCSYCMKCFTTTGDLARHVRIHTGEKPYKCSYCTKCFTQSSVLARHVRTHTGE